jgi:CheY-like chemotaxis protein
MQPSVLRRRMLVIDDNLDAAIALSRFFELLGHEAHTATDVTTGVLLARRLKPEFVFIDIGLPELDGFQIAAILRSEPGTASAKIIAVTGYGRTEDRRRAEEVGIDHYLLKPVDFKFLESLVGNAAPKP